MVIRVRRSVDHTRLHFPENIALKLLLSGLDREQSLGSGGEKLSGRVCRCEPRKQSGKNIKISCILLHNVAWG